MPLFRRTCQGIEAHQYFPRDHEKHKEIVGVVAFQQPWGSNPLFRDGVDTLGHRIYLNSGDWVVVDENGQRWVCPNELFAKLFRLVERE